MRILFKDISVFFICRGGVHHIYRILSYPNRMPRQYAGIYGSFGGNGSNIIAEERFEPAVVSVGSFLLGYCVHLAKALRAKCGLPAFALVDRGGELVHAYNIKWTPDKGKLYFDARGITDRSDLFIEPFQGLPDLKETALDTVLETVPQWTFMEDEVSDAMVRWFVENYTDIWRMKENKDSPID